LCFAGPQSSSSNYCPGLGTVYGINAALAVLAAFKAAERGQPAGLWIAKTFTVGGLAYDQLTQLPTKEEVELAKARKGKKRGSSSARGSSSNSNNKKGSNSSRY
jgi:hypothetical protein